uniref:Endonuclease_NS domain-containing protein n=1 Tax=Meloidogyne hapla TaxID=6305 RepID=A0A1I8BGF7_MELHA
MITGPLSVRRPNSKKDEKEFQFKGLFNEYTFNNSIKHPKTTHFFKILLIEIKKENYCVDILLIRATRTELDEGLINQNKSRDCGKSKLNEFGNNWKVQLGFIEWFLGVDLEEFIEAAGIEYKNGIKICSNKQLIGKNIQTKKSNEINLINIIKPTFEHKFNKICQKETDKPNIRIYQDFLVSFDRKRKIPKWTLELLDPSIVNTIESGHRCLMWENDPKFREDFQPVYHDYDDGKKYDLEHGHMVPAYNHPSSVKKTFYFTNSAPQNKDVNRGHWRVIEEYIL